MVGVISFGVFVGSVIVIVERRLFVMLFVSLLIMFVVVGVMRNKLVCLVSLI